MPLARSLRIKPIVFPVVAAMLVATSAMAQAQQDSQEIDWLELALGMMGGLALFLYGVEVLARKLKETQGGRFQKMLERFSANRVSSLAGGTIATVALDSSSVVIILMIAAVDAGLVSFANALPAILGANIGTTVSSQVFAWNVDQYAPVLMAGSLLWHALARSDRTKRHASVVLGIGLVLFGLHVIGDAAEPLKDHKDVIAYLQKLENPLLGVLAGALVTVAIQSSSAMMGIIITLAGSGLISLDAGLAMMLGAEIGTCADTLVATVGRSRAAVKAGMFHLLFNVCTVAIGVVLISLLARFGTATASDVGQQIANAHVLFNIAGALLALPFVRSAATLLDRIVPEREGSAEVGQAPLARDA